MKKFILKSEYITLGQFLKIEGFVSSGGMVKAYLEVNEISLNNVKENRRGKKIFSGDVLEVSGKKYIFSND